MYIDFVLEGLKNNALDDENLEQLNTLLELLGAKAEIRLHTGAESKSRYLVITANDEIVRQKRTRGAGRKVNSDASIEKWSQFCELKAEGKNKDEIMEIMGISRATYYRYLKSY